MRTRMLPVSRVRQIATPVSPLCSVAGTVSHTVVQNATSSMRIVSWTSLRWRGGSAPPAQHAWFDRVDEVAAFDSGARVFLLQAVVPFRLSVGIVYQEERRRMTQALLLQCDDVAVLVEKFAHEGAQQRAQRTEP